MQGSKVTVPGSHILRVYSALQAGLDTCCITAGGLLQIGDILALQSGVYSSLCTIDVSK